jgi:ribosomal protein S18 acetylase RimI-like enzyme
MSGMPVIFRRAEPADLPALIALLADDELGSRREDPGSPPNSRYVAALQAITADPNQLLAVAEDAGAVVGCLQISFIPGLTRTGMWRGQIEGVRIANGQRGTGIGREMFTWAIERCRERDCGLVQLTTDKGRPDAHAFYAALGFSASHEGMKLNLSK